MPVVRPARIAVPAAAAASVVMMQARESRAEAGDGAEREDGDQKSGVSHD
jgi:hypothetical protein